MVLGTSNTAVTWSINPPVGTMSSAGLYTAPSSILTSQTVTVTAQSAADPTKSASGVVSLQITSTSGSFTYYVDSANGSDSNPGTLAKPWQTIAKVNSTELMPGQSVGFASGGVWRETLAPGQSGTAASPIAFGAYGSGPAPIISGATTVTSWTACSTNGTSAGVSCPSNVWLASYGSTPLAGMVFINGIQGTPVASLVALTAPGEWYYAGGTLSIYATTDPNTSIIEVGTSRIPISLYAQNYVTLTGLSVGKSNASGVFLNNVSHIDLNRVSSTYNYIRGVDNAGTSGDISSYVTVENGTFSNNGTSGIEFHGGGGPGRYGQLTNFTIQNNLVSGNGWQSTYTIYTSGIKVWGSYGNPPTNNDFTIQKNIVSNTSSADGTGQGVGIWADEMGTGVLIQNNTVYNNAGSGIMVEHHSGTMVAYNVSYNNAPSWLLGVLWPQIYVARGAISSSIFNNTCYGGAVGIAVEDLSQLLPVTNNIVTNNIVSGYSSLAFRAQHGGENAGTGAGNVYTYNSFGSQTANFIEWGHGVFESTYAAFDIGYQNATHSLTTDPLLSNPAAGDFVLQPGSPAIGAGLYIAGVSTSVPPNIGAQ
jgi:hypothetical protein